MKKSFGKHFHLVFICPAVSLIILVACQKGEIQSYPDGSKHLVKNPLQIYYYTEHHFNSLQEPIRKELLIKMLLGILKIFLREPTGMQDVI